MPPVDALHLRTTLHEQVRQMMFNQLLDEYARIDAKELHRPEQLAIRTFGATAFANALSMCELFYLAPDMHQLAMLASEDFPEDETLLAEDLPSDAGLMYLPARFRMIELRGRLEVVHACLWYGQRVWMLTDRTDPESEMSREVLEEGIKTGVTRQDFMRRFGKWDVCGSLPFAFGRPIPQTFTLPKGVLPSSATVSFQETADGKMAMYTDHPVDLQTEELGRSTPDPFLKFLLSTWRLMQQTLSDVRETTDLPRADRRRAERKHIPTGVTVIQLRRIKRDYESTGEGINYRTLVRGHWRRVWCGKHDEERYQRAVYIHPFIRGPEDAPLIIRQRVNALVR